MRVGLVSAKIIPLKNVQRLDEKLPAMMRCHDCPAVYGMRNAQCHRLLETSEQRSHMLFMHILADTHLELNTYCLESGPAVAK
jgi:hypothetical protein